MREAWIGLVIGAAVTSCGGAQSAGSPGAPARAEGCAIEIVREGMPARATRRLGEVVARCHGEYAHDEARCTRQLEDQACRLGAVVIQDVSSGPIAGEGDDALQMRASAAVYRE